MHASMHLRMAFDEYACLACLPVMNRLMPACKSLAASEKRDRDACKHIALMMILHWDQHP